VGEVVGGWRRRSYIHTILRYKKGKHNKTRSKHNEYETCRTKVTRKVGVEILQRLRRLFLVMFEGMGEAGVCCRTEVQHRGRHRGDHGTEATTHPSKLHP
jgi:hypothetical protein